MLGAAEGRSVERLVTELHGHVLLEEAQNGGQQRHVVVEVRADVMQEREEHRREVIVAADLVCIASVLVLGFHR